MLEQRKLLKQENMAVRWGEMDALGHVNSTVYFVYFEQIRVAWLDELGIAIESSGLGPVVVNSCATYHRPIVYPAQIEVTLYGGAAGRSSFETYYEICNVNNRDEVCASGSAKVVWIDYSEACSVPLPDSIRSLLTAV